MQLAGIHTPSDIGDIPSEGGGQILSLYTPFGNEQVRLLLRSAGLGACHAEEEAASATRLLVESMGASVANVS
eukprot:121910-Pyramimonas_sp.AAC.1